MLSLSLPNRSLDHALMTTHSNVRLYNFYVLLPIYTTLFVTDPDISCHCEILYICGVARRQTAVPGYDERTWLIVIAYSTRLFLLLVVCYLNCMYRCISLLINFLQTGNTRRHMYDYHWLKYSWTWRPSRIDQEHGYKGYGEKVFKERIMQHLGWRLNR